MSKNKQESHVVWKCDYHVVWCPKYRFRILTGIVKDLVEHDIRMLCEWKGCDVLMETKSRRKTISPFSYPNHHRRVVCIDRSDYISVISWYFGTSDFMMLHPSR